MARMTCTSARLPSTHQPAPQSARARASLSAPQMRSQCRSQARGAWSTPKEAWMRSPTVSPRTAATAAEGAFPSARTIASTHTCTPLTSRTSASCSTALMHSRSTLGRVTSVAASLPRSGLSSASRRRARLSCSPSRRPTWARRWARICARSTRSCVARARRPRPSYRSCGSSMADQCPAMWAKARARPRSSSPRGSSQSTRSRSARACTSRAWRVARMRTLRTVSLCAGF
mmetsp:Transcript_20191/g.52080  ORF Transcript_20191/g.52080 Transcript_20191/m.52080 type:complete len:231 (+) Transcript_20191:437-1129(+)